MVDKSENILVEFDYNNITIIDPNKVIDENGKAKERVVKQEDLVIYANLECDVLPRTKLALGVANNDAIKTVSIAKINFLKPGNKQFLDNSYTDEITGRGSLEGKGDNQVRLNSIKNPRNSNDTYITQNLLTEGKSGAVDNGLLGINSINIRQNTSFMPTIVIKLVDVKGRALFEGADNSPYAAFFNLPYPIFYLTIKGYYGKAVRLTLMLQNFTSSYNYSSTNFDITLTFYTYKYSVLGEVAMGGLLSVPHMFKNNISIETTQGTPSQYVQVKDSVVTRGYQKIKEVYSEYKTKGLIPDDFPEITIQQMKNSIDNFIKNVFDSFTKQNMIPLTNLSEYQKTIGEYEKEVYTAINASWFKKNMDTENYFIYEKGAEKYKIYTFKNTITDTTTAINDLESIITKYNKLLNENKTVGQNGNYKINGSETSSKIECKISLNDFKVEVTNFDADINLKETFVQRKKSKEYPSEDSLEYKNFKLEVSKFNNFQSGEFKKEDGGIVKVQYWFRFENENTNDFKNSVLGPNASFVDKLNQISKVLKDTREKIESDLTNALFELLQNKQSGIGFIPNIRNVLAVIFACGEAFVRLLDDTSDAAWALNTNETALKYRKQAIFNDQVTSASPDNLSSGANESEPIYPWPELIVATTGEKGQEKYEIRYPGDVTLRNQIKSNIPDVWPEVEFVEEFVRALTEKENLPKTPTIGSNEELDIKRVTLNSIEFPIANDIYSNKEEVKFFFEIYERVLFISTTSKLSRVLNSQTEIDKIIDLISESETQNMLNGLSSSDPYIIKKLTEYGFNAINFLPTLRHFSNEGLGQSWQNLIRGIYNTPYIKNKNINNGFEFINSGILNNAKAQPLISLLNENTITEYVTGSTTSNEFDFTDLYPFINDEWVKNNLANSTSVSNAKTAFNTTKVLSFNQSKKIVCNFVEGADSKNRRPITNFNYINYEYPSFGGQPVDSFNLKNFYQNRLIKEQLPTEGNVFYSGYTNQLNYLQTTSIFNTPYFINSIQEGIDKFRNFDEHPFVSSAYYFINSLPLATLKEKYKSYENNATTDLDYIFATIKKFGAIHKVPYAWILKIGSVWHRYKTFIETSVDILDNTWTNFNYTENYDPITNDPTKTYSFNNNGQLTEIVLQKTSFIGGDEYNTINLGFYPKLIDDFNVFYQGFQIYGDYNNTEIQSGFNSGITLNFVSDAYINLQKGFDDSNLNRTLTIVPWSLTVESVNGIDLFVLPSQGSLFNQTLNECFDTNTAPTYKIKNEVINNNSMYNGSARLFWAAPNYGFFNDDLIYKPSPYEYMKKMITGETSQENFSLRYLGDYSDLSEVFSVFEKDILDKFETIFLNFSKSIYDFDDESFSDNQNLSEISGNNQESGSEKIFKNFQSLMRSMMKIPKETFDDGNDFVLKIQNAQLNNIVQNISGFLNYDIVFKYGNPSSFDRRLFQTFSQLAIIDPYTWEDYSVTTPNALPSNGGSVTLAQSIFDYPNEWKTLQTYVGFSEINNVKYSSNGSYITDFFIDLNIAFTVDNIKNFAPIIKLYASQKLKDNTLDLTKFYDLMTDYLVSNIDFQNKITTNLFIKLQNKLPKATITNETQSQSAISGGDQTKSEIYQTFKALNDKWISGNDFKTKTLFEDVLMMDRASRNIGDKILVDIFKLQNMLTNINTSTSMLTFAQSILIDNHFVVMNLPSYVNFYNVQDAVKNPTPRAEGTLEFANTLFGTYLNVDYRDSSAKMICFYGGKPSEQLNLKNNTDFRFKTDAFDLRRASDNPLVENQIDKKDWALSNKVVGFNVDIGPQNQQIFMGFDVSQTAGKATTESIEVLNQMSNLNNNRGGSSQSISLYNLYKNRSYTCQVTMMGNALIQPTMYFNLRYVPMFSGPYMILEVNHTISQGSFTTYIRGVRQPTAGFPITEDYIQSLKTNLLTSIIDKVEKDKKEADKKKAENGTVQGQKQNNVNNVNGNGINNSSAKDCQDLLNEKYNTYVLGEPTKTKLTHRGMKRLIVQKTQNIGNATDREKLQYAIFVKFYLGCGTNRFFDTYSNNYGIIQLDSNWRDNSKYFTQDKYFCANNIPFAIFNSADDCVDFFISKWSQRMGLISGINKESIFKFIYLNSGSETAQENTYTTLDANEKSDLESRTKKGIDLFDSM